MDESVEALVAALNRGEDWEAALFEEACRLAREWASRLFTAVDEALAEQEGRALRVEGSRTRRILTRLGPIQVRRRLYRDGARRRFLLDEAMGWERGKVLSPSLQALALQLVAELSYRKAAQFLDGLVSQSIGRMTLHRLVQTVGKRASEQEEATRHAVYEADQAAPRGPIAADPLFLEGDGVSIALQREAERRTEVKVAMAYAGSQKLSVDRHGTTRRALTGKVSFASLEPPVPFWEKAWLQIGARYDTQRTSQMILNGDGAAWVRRGLVGHRGLFQLDRFHLARELCRVLGPSGMPVFHALCTGDDPTAKALLAEAWDQVGTDPTRAGELLGLEHYLSTNHDGLVDWYRRVDPPPVDPVPMGAMEANIDKPFATRFKRRGMSWTRTGAHHLAKVLQLRANGDLQGACRRPVHVPPLSVSPVRRASAASVAPSKTAPSEPPFQATLVPRWGPHAARPWVRILCELTREPTIR